MYKLSKMEWNGLGRVYRDGEFEYFGLLNYENAPGTILSFYGNAAFRDHLNNEKIKCVICTEELADTLPTHIEGVVISDNPLFCFWQMHNQYGKTERYQFKTEIDSSAQISERACVAPYGVLIGKNTVVEEFVSIKEGTRIGDNVVVRSGTVLGQDCFIASRNEGDIYLSTLYGGVKIGNSVYIGSNNVITRGTLEWLDTYIDDGTKINANCCISHNVSIGKNGMICDGVLISGDCHIGNEVWMSPGVQTTNSIRIGNNVNLMLGTIARKDIDNDMVVVGEHVYRRDIYYAIRKMKK